MKEKTSIKTSEIGVSCHRCGQPTSVRQRIAVGERELRNAWYYSKWYVCENRDCRTTLIMPQGDEFKVFNRIQKKRHIACSHVYVCKHCGKYRKEKQRNAKPNGYLGHDKQVASSVYRETQQAHQEYLSMLGDD